MSNPSFLDCLIFFLVDMLMVVPFYFIGLILGYRITARKENDISNESGDRG
ncbi:MAG: hypothetical protein FWD43_03955 [Coriobacteriia bacterium]|nr:hypothetical protein [Coriobacteriia bacterium]